MEKNNDIAGQIIIAEMLRKVYSGLGRCVVSGAGFRKYSQGHRDRDAANLIPCYSLR